MKTIPTYQDLVNQIESLKLKYDEVVNQSDKRLRGAEKKSGSSDIRLEQLIQSLEQGYLLVDSKGCITKANHTIAKMFGYKNPEEMVGIRTIDLFANSGDRDVMLKEISEKGKLKNYELLFQKKNRATFWALCNIIRITNEKGEHIGTEGLVLDISKQKETENKLIESEEKFRAIFNDSKTIGLLINPENKKIIDANHVACKFYGYSHQVLTTKKISEINQLSVLDVKSKIKAATEEDENSFEFKHKLSNGTIKDVEVFSSPIIINKEKVLFSIIHDITDRKLAEQALKESEEKLRIANSTKDKFFSIIAHDLRNPFNSILGHSEILYNNFDIFDSEKQKRFVGIINTGINRTYKLLTNLLLWSSSQRGVIVFNPEKIYLYLLFSDSMRLLNQSADDKSIRLQAQIPEDIIVNADREMLSIIIRNLITNAIKFTPKGGEIIITACLVSDKNNGGFAEITISDNGVGISSQVQSKLFDVGQDVFTTGTDDEKGTGLGLVLCKEFVEKHGGEIWVKSEIDKGSQFIFTLPTVK